MKKGTRTVVVLGGGLREIRKRGISSVYCLNEGLGNDI
jgi:hypothetical protein